MPTDHERRRKVSFNAFYFEQEKQKNQFHSYDMKNTFQHIHDVNLWGSNESVSGEGSTDQQTVHLKEELPSLFQTLNIETLLDAPCGDFGWLSSIALPISQYIGIDILDHFIDHHKKHFEQNPFYHFYQADISCDPLPMADLILCRDCLVHFSYTDIYKTLENFKRSGSRYLLTTTFTDTIENVDIVTGDWRSLNLERPPFNFFKPEKIIVEGCIESGDLYKDKCLGLWDLQKLS